MVIKYNKNIIHKGVDKYIQAESIFFWVSGMNDAEVICF